MQLSVKKNYSRFFIILQEDQKGYGMESDKTPSGYTKLETKNGKTKVCYYVQNLKKQKGPFYMILIVNNNEKGLINLNKLIIDDNGRADVIYEYDSNNIGEVNVDAEKVLGAAICTLNGERVNPVMVGFITADNLAGWKNYPMIKPAVKKSEVKIQEHKKSDNTIKMEEKITTQPKPSYEKDTDCEEKIKVKKDSEKENKIFDENNTVKKEIKSEDKKATNKNECDDKDQCNKEHKHEEFDEYEKKIEEIKKDKNPNKLKEGKEMLKYPTGNMGEFFKEIVKDLEIVGQNPNMKNCMWYKAHINKLDDMYCLYDYNKYAVIYYPMVCYYPYISRYKHFMIGYKWDDDGKLRYIVYAVPGTKAIEDQPYGGRTGFVTFMPNDKDDNDGYWLMYYDIKGNTVVVPVKKQSK